MADQHQNEQRSIIDDESVAADLALNALCDDTRREIFERILARPTRVSLLAQEMNHLHSRISYHIKVLKTAGVVRSTKDGLLFAVPGSLPALRNYIDRLWFEAAVGEAWITSRAAMGRRLNWREAQVGGEPDER